MSTAQERDVTVGGVTLAVRVHPATGPATGGALLVHGLASNARMWDACAQALATTGVACAAVDLRGHGRTAGLGTPGPFTTGSAAEDVAGLLDVLRADGTLPGPVVVAGQSWGGNVVLTATAGGAAADALALVDGGWLRFDTDEPFERLWDRLAPPDWGGTTWPDLTSRLEGVLGDWGPHALPAVLANLTTDADGVVRNVLARDAHQEILRSMYEADPRTLYPAVRVPVLLAPAGDGPASAFVDEAAEALVDAHVVRYEGAHHDLHLQHPDRLAADLTSLLDRTPGRAPGTDPARDPHPTTTSEDTTR